MEDRPYQVRRGFIELALRPGDMDPEDKILMADGTWIPAKNYEPFKQVMLARASKALSQAIQRAYTIKPLTNPFPGETEVRLPGLTVIDRGHDTGETILRIFGTVVAAVVGVKVGVAIGNRIAEAIES